MLEEKDLKAIGVLLDQKLEINKREITAEFADKFDEVISIVNDGFSEMQVQFEDLKTELKGDIENIKVELAKRPTKNEVFSWADRRLIDLEIAKERYDYLHIAKERYDYLHIDELDKLPAPAEINRVLIERGFKQKLA